MSAEYRTKTMKVGSATVIVHRPVLSSAEYQKRERNVRAALETYGRAINLQSVSK